MELRSELLLTCMVALGTCTWTTNWKSRLAATAEVPTDMHEWLRWSMAPPPNPKTDTTWLCRPPSNCLVARLSNCGEYYMGQAYLSSLVQATHNLIMCPHKYRPQLFQISVVVISLWRWPLCLGTWFGALCNAYTVTGTNHCASSQSGGLCQRSCVCLWTELPPRELNYKMHQ